LPANHADPDSATTITISSPDDKGKIFTAVEQFPSFPGGTNAFYKFLAKNIRYPAEAVKNNTQGTVIIGFVVEADGQLTNVKIIKGVSPEIDAEAIRVIQISPKWKPALQNNKPVRVQFRMPISFSLANK